MKLVYVTSSLPHGPLEAFVLPEIAALERLGHEVWIVPMWPRGDVVHADAEAFAAHAQRAAALLGSAWLGGPRSAAGAARPDAPLAPSHRREEPPRAPEGALARAMLRELPPDHVHAHWISTSATLAMVAAERAGSPGA